MAYGSDRYTSGEQDGNVTLGVDGSGVITVDKGAVIDVGLSTGDANSVNRLVPFAGTTGGTSYTYVAADQGGTVTFAAPVIQQQGGGDTVNVGVQGSVIEREQHRARGFRKPGTSPRSMPTPVSAVSASINDQTVLDTSATIAGELNFLTDNGAGTLVQFIQNFNISAAYSGLGGLASQANFHARPGVQLDYFGDVVLQLELESGAWRGRYSRSA